MLETPTGRVVGVGPMGPGPNDRGLSRQHILSAVNDSLRRLGTDYVDLYQIHRWNNETPIEETMETLHVLYREEEREMIPLCLDMGIGVLPWSPLARGWLTGSRSRHGERHTTRAGNDDFASRLYDESDCDVIDAVTALAAERGLSPAQIALAWLLHKPGVTAPIMGATKVEHLDDALAALDVTLTETELHRLEERYRPHGVRGFG